MQLEQFFPFLSSNIFDLHILCLQQQIIYPMIRYNYLLIFMNHQYYFQPFWHFVSPSQLFPIIPVSPFQNYSLLKTIETCDDTFPNTILQKKTKEITEDHENSERKAEDKRKSIKKVKEDKNFSYRYQDKDRNIYSNILKGFVLKIRQDHKFQAQCQNLIKITKSTIDVDDLSEFIDKNFQKTKTYISPTFMKKVLENNMGTEMGRYFRLLMSKYLKESFPLVLLASQRIQKHSKLLQMKKARELYELLFGGEPKQEEEFQYMEQSR